MKQKSPRALARIENDPSPDTCRVPSWLLNTVRKTVNRALGFGLGGIDPLNVSLHSLEHEIDLWGCNIGLEMDTRVMLSGFRDASVVDLSCSSYKCLVDGVFGCKLREYEITTEVKFGELVSASGSGEANWTLCSLDFDKGLELGVNSVRPGGKLSIVVEERPGLTVMIKRVSELESHPGKLQNFKCGFSSLPNFIGSVLEQWCVSIVEWLVNQVLIHLKDDIDKLLLDLANTILPSK